MSNEIGLHCVRDRISNVRSTFIFLRVIPRNFWYYGLLFSPLSLSTMWLKWQRLKRRMVGWQNKFANCLTGWTTLQVFSVLELQEARGWTLVYALLFKEMWEPETTTDYKWPLKCYIVYTLIRLYRKHIYVSYSLITVGKQFVIWQLCLQW